MPRPANIFIGLLVALTASISQSANADVLRIGGTGTVLALMSGLAEPFARYAPGDSLDVVPGLGSSGAINAATHGALDIAFSGRALSVKEMDAGLKQIPLLETPFVFVAATRETPHLKRDDIRRIYAGEAFIFESGEAARLILRPRSDASVGLLISIIDGMAAAMDRARQRPDIPVAANDQDNMEAASRIRGSFTGMTLTQLTLEPNGLRHVVVDGVAPTVEAMQAKAYPWGQKTFLAYKGELSPVGKKFIAFLATDETKRLIQRAGAVPLQ